ncbi:hypothetical protein EVAR_100306_1 [Eumeta japonica]|uniref:Mos1 transposase HTH domain-containing protein n=1 Tax=Eumeta variegata TaxID=151549 RepID=A0A4C1ZT99_EUMVA|nr:hypothetical protein EVAR_100306_1 [Eumeta japonica]
MTIGNWFVEFKRGRVNLSDEFRDDPLRGRRSGRPNNKNIDAVRRMIETDRHVSYHEELRTNFAVNDFHHQKWLSKSIKNMFLRSPGRSGVNVFEIGSSCLQIERQEVNRVRLSVGPKSRLARNSLATSFIRFPL